MSGNRTMSEMASKLPKSIHQAVFFYEWKGCEFFNYNNSIFMVIKTHWEISKKSTGYTITSNSLPGLTQYPTNCMNQDCEMGEHINNRLFMIALEKSSSWRYVAIFHSRWLTSLLTVCIGCVVLVKLYLVISACTYQSRGIVSYLRNIESWLLLLLAVTTKYESSPESTSHSCC